MNRDRMLSERISELRRALEFYGDRRNYTEPSGRELCPQHGTTACAMFHRDAYDGDGPGARARATLAAGTTTARDPATMEHEYQRDRAAILSTAVGVARLKLANGKTDEARAALDGAAAATRLLLATDLERAAENGSR